MAVKPINWENYTLKLLDQTRLPGATEYIEITDLDGAIAAIRKMIVRGAPAIAITGMFGVALYVRNAAAKPSFAGFGKRLGDLLESRPTAVNLRLALDGLYRLLPEKIYNEKNLDEIRNIVTEYAAGLYEDDIRQNRALAENALPLFAGGEKKISILTHCNTGSLATAGHGTALGVVRTLKEHGYDVTVYADETRPYLQGSRLTAWEMMEEGIECYIITDSMSGWLMADRKIDAVIVGADRIAANGDTANKIGTYALSILAREHKVPFYVACTENSFDFGLRTGREIVIEMRDESELLSNSFMKNDNGGPLFPAGLFAPPGARALNPAFDVTPVKNISAFITEKGLIRSPDTAGIAAVVKEK